MKELLLFVVILLFFYCLGWIGKEKERYSLLSIRHTTLLRGWAILTVLFCHIGRALGVGKIQFIAGIGVSLFLILSGYGLHQSYKKNGLEGFWSKRLFRVILPYYAISFLLCFLLGELSGAKIVQILIFKPMWYISYLLVWYLLFYAAAMICRRYQAGDRQMLILLAVSAAVWFVIDSLFFAAGDTVELRARQMPSFVFGVALSMFPDDMISKMKGGRGGYKAALTLLSVICLFMTQIKFIESFPPILFNIIALPTVFILAATVLVSSFYFIRIWNNRFLFFMGKYSFEIYLTQAYLQSLIRDNKEYWLPTAVLIIGLAVMEHTIWRKLRPNL